MFRTFRRLSLALIVGLMPFRANAADFPSDSFNAYILKAIEQIYAEYPHKGYDITKAYTHEIPYGDGKIKPSKPPLTMCVAAVAEVIITAINIYSAETGDKSPYEYLKADGWNRMRPTDIRSHIWVDPKLDSYGTADALVTFGIGKRVKFSELTPGSFINLNRNIPGRKPSGHAVIFLGYIDDHGNVLDNYSNAVVGFRYFSSQGKGEEGGFGYRYGFFMKSGSTMFCPDLGADKKHDCGITFSQSQKLLNTGYLFNPSNWNKSQRDQNLSEVVAGLYQQSRARGGSTYLGIPSEVSLEEFTTELETTDTMELNPLFLNDQTTDD
jgi:hypothetical protein